MKDYQKLNLLRALTDLTDRIDEMTDAIIKTAEDPTGWCVTETIQTYASRLNGFIIERRGICSALCMLGYRVVWKNDRPIKIEEDE